MDFYSKIGTVALGSRLRRLAEKLMEDAANIYNLYGVELDPKWFPVFIVLQDQKEGVAITEIARQIGHSHPSVSQMVKEMTRKGIIKARKSTQDGRINLIYLTDKGRAIGKKMEIQLQDVQAAAKELIAQSHHNLWKAIEDTEYLLSKENFYKRVLKKRKERESRLVEIIDYDPRYKKDFADLNYAWIRQYFKIEERDRMSLDHPETKILEPGGYICFAKYKGEIVGTCALMKMDDDTYELAKMAVSPKAQGKKIGWLLGQRIIEKAKELGARKVYLESNTILTPAINLYYKLGFERIVGPPSPYERANIQMEKSLE